MGLVECIGQYHQQANCHEFGLSINRVATNLKNLEYSGIYLNMEYSGTVQPQGKIVINKVFLVRHSNIWSECGGDLLCCWS